MGAHETERGEGTRQNVMGEEERRAGKQMAYFMPETASSEV